MLEEPLGMNLQDSPFPFDGPYSPIQRKPYRSDRLPYSPSDNPLYGINRGQFSRKSREMGEAFVYLWYDAGWKRTGGPRYYIGKHKGTLDSGYVCSSNYMKPEWEERGCKQEGCRHLFGDEGHHGDFHRRVLAYGDEREMVKFEVGLLRRREHYFRTRYYNRIVVWVPSLSGEKSSAYKHGLSGTPEYQRQWREQHREEIAQYNKQNKKEIALYQKQWAEKNREKLSLYQKQYRERKKQEKLESTSQLER